MELGAILGVVFGLLVVAFSVVTTMKIADNIKNTLKK